MLSALAETKKSELMGAVDERMEKAKQDAEHSNNQVPPGLMLYEYGETRVSTAQGPSTGITSAIDGLLHDPAENWKSAVSSLATTALNTILGAGSGASSNLSLYMIALDGHPADAAKKLEDTQVAVRIDYCLWIYNFASMGVKEVAQSAIAYFARKSLIDYTHIASDVVIDEILKNIGMTQALREELLKRLDMEKKNGAEHPPLRAYANSLPTGTKNSLAKHFGIAL